MTYGFDGRAAELGDTIAAVLFLAAAALVIAADVLIARIAVRWHTRRNRN